MSSALGSLVASVSLRTAEFKEGVRDVTAELGRFRAQSESQFNSVKGGLVGIAGALAGAFSVDVFRGFVDSLDQVNERSERLDLTARELQEIGYAAKLSGVDSDTFAKGLRAISLAAVEAQDKNSKAAEAFRLIGVETKAANGAVKSGLQLFLETADGLNMFAAGAEKSAIGNELLKKSYETLNPLIKQGSQGIRETIDEGVKLGAVLSDDLIKNAALFNDNLDRLAVLAKAGAASLAGPLLQAVNDVTSAYIKGRAAGLGFFDALGAADASTGASFATDKVNQYAKEIKDLTKSLELYRGADFSGRPNSASLEQGRQKNIDEISQKLDIVKKKYEIASEAQDRFFNRTNIGRSAKREVPSIAEQLGVTDLRPTLRPLGEGRGGIASPAKKSDYETQLERVQKAAVDAANGTSQLTAAERLRSDLMFTLSDQTKKFTALERDRLTQAIEGVIAAERSVKSQEALAEAERKRNELSAKQTEQYLRERFAQETLNEQLRQEAENIGKTTGELAALNATRRQAEVARLEEQVAALAGYDLGTKELEQLREILALKKEEALLRGQVDNKNVQNETDQEKRRASEDLAREREQFKDGIARAFVAGPKSLREALKNEVFEIKVKLAKKALDSLLDELFVTLRGSGTGSSSGGGLLSQLSQLFKFLPPMFGTGAAGMGAEKSVAMVQNNYFSSGVDSAAMRGFANDIKQSTLADVSSALNRNAPGFA